MTPLRMRLFIIAFAALATATTINALYLQEAPRHVAGVRTMPQPDPQPVKIAAVERPDPAPSPAAVQSPPTASIPQVETPAPSQTGAQPEPSQPAVAAVSEPVAPPAPRVPPAGPEELPPPSPLVKSIQRELATRGYVSARSDGVLTLDMRAAILAYEFDEKMPLTGEASEGVLKSLIFARASGVPSKAKGASSSRFEQRGDIIGAVQHMLAQFGYMPGPANGQLDERTRDAIRKFQEDRRMKHPSGHLTERVLLEMVIVTGRPISING